MMNDYLDTTNVLCNKLIKRRKKSVSEKNHAMLHLFLFLQKQMPLSQSILIFCTCSGTILDVKAPGKSGKYIGSFLEMNTLAEVCPNLLIYNDISGYSLITSDETDLIPGTHHFITCFKEAAMILEEYAKEPEHLLQCLDAAKKSISIFDKDVHLLFANKHYCNYLNIKDRESSIGMNIDDILRKYGTTVHSIETNSERLKIHDVITSKEEVLDWEIKVESASGDTQIVGNDLYPILNDDGEVEGIVEITHSRQQLLKSVQNYAGLSAEYTFQNIIGSSPGIRECIRMAKNYAPSILSLMITGESGVGKELFAQSIHNYSPRNKGPFVALNCASFPENLIESELFGYVGGAFTGASKKGQMGKFELAEGGTLFLDEVGELPLPFQAKLLRVLETWTVTRIGASKPIPINVRLIAATNRNLEEMVEEGLFRQDLYYRLQILNIHIPPLRERQDDILPIAESLLAHNKDVVTNQTKKLSPEAKQALIEYEWPGNVRELRNVLYRASLLSPTDVIQRDIIEASFFGKKSAAILAQTSNTQQSKTDSIESKSSMDRISASKISTEERSKLSTQERLSLRRQEVDQANINLIKEAIEISGNNKSKAADLLGWSRNTFYRMLKKYNI